MKCSLLAMVQYIPIRFIIESSVIKGAQHVPAERQMSLDAMSNQLVPNYPLSRMGGLG